MNKKMQKSGLAIASLILGIMSLIPLIGLFLGVITIILGIVAIRQINKLKLEGKKMAIASIILGTLGIISTVMIYGSLYYFGFVSDKGPWAELKPKATQQILVQNAGALEIYKKNNGEYPKSLNEMIQEDFVVMTIDNYLNEIFYQVSQDHQSYDLRSLGVDGEYGTSDDILLPHSNN